MIMRMQNKMDQLVKWTEKWQMEFNARRRLRGDLIDVAKIIRGIQKIYRNISLNGNVKY